MERKLVIEVDGSQYHLDNADERVVYGGVRYNRVPDGMRLVDKDVKALAKLEAPEEHILDALYDFFFTAAKNLPQKEGESKKQVVNDLEIRMKRYALWYRSDETGWDVETLIQELAKKLADRFA